MTAEGAGLLARCLRTYHRCECQRAADGRLSRGEPVSNEAEARDLLDDIHALTARYFELCQVAQIKLETCPICARLWGDLPMSEVMACPACLALYREQRANERERIA